MFIPVKAHGGQSSSLWRVTVVSHMLRPEKSPQERASVWKDGDREQKGSLSEGGDGRWDRQR